MHDAAHDMLRRDGLADHAARVDRLRAAVPAARRRNPAETTTARRSWRTAPACRGPSSGAICRATSRSAGALTAMTTRSCGPSDCGVGRWPARDGSRCCWASPLPVRRRRPSCCSAASVRPRASRETSQPARARPAPSQPPMAPAPTMQVLLKLDGHGCCVQLPVAGVDAIDLAHQCVEHVLAGAVVGVELQRVAARSAPRPRPGPGSPAPCSAWPAGSRRRAAASTGSRRSAAASGPRPAGRGCAGSPPACRRCSPAGAALRRHGW